MNIFKKTNGAVSVFLVIILVPCMLASSLFVDLGRVYLSKGMAKSASDLALNTLMTKYDYDLKEFYGLAASCQTIEEFYGVATEYFQRTMASRGLSDDEIVLLSDYFESEMKAAAESEDKISDFLKTSAVSDVTISPVDGANMANATMLKDGIIEFMKYRAPIEIINRAFLTKLSGSKEQLEGAEKDDKLLETKETYYKSEKTFNEQAKTIYDLIQEYKKHNVDETTISDMLGKLNSYEGLYKEIHSAFVHDISNTIGLGSLVRTLYDYKNSSFAVYTYYEYSDVDKKLATEDDLIKLLKELIVAIKNYDNAKTQLEGAFITYNKGTGDSNTYDIQYWNQSSNAIKVKLGNLNSKSAELLKKYNAVENALAYLYVDDAKSFNNSDAVPWKISDEAYSIYWGFEEELTTKEHYEKVKSQFMEIYNKYINTLTADEANSDKYIKYMSILERISCDDTNIKKISVATNNIPSSGKSVEQTVSDIYTEISQMKTAVEGYKSELSTIISELEKLEVARADYVSKYGTWKNTADGTDTELGESDRLEIYGGEGASGTPIEETMDDVSAEQITAMISRLNNIIAVYDYILDVINGMKYGSKKVVEIENATSALSLSGIDNSKIGLTNGQLSQYTDTSFSFTKYNNSDASISINDSNNPDIEHEPIPDLYDWMLSKDWGRTKTRVEKCSKCGKEFDAACYNDIITYNPHDGEETVKVDKTLCPECMYSGNGDSDKGYEGDAENSEKYSGDATSPASKDITSLSGSFPSGFSQDEVGLMDNLSGIVNLASDFVDDFGLGAEKVRDSLYTTEYVFGMFSHAAFENEAKYDIVLNNLTDLGLTEESFYKLSKSQFVNNYYENDTVKNIWKSDEPTEKRNKSLTNNLINAENNYAYLGEIEYILRGKANNENLSSIYGSIYLTRYITNSVAGFATFWNKPSSQASNEIIAKFAAYQSIAFAVSSATLEVVPKALVKTVLILIEVGIETALDMEYLKAGIPVKFIKGKEDKNWGFTRELEKNAFNIQYSDYLYVFMLTGLMNDDSMNAIYTRMSDVIQANMRNITNSESYQLNKSITHFKFSATLRVSPLMVTLPIFNNYETGIDSATDWCTYNITTTRGY